MTLFYFWEYLLSFWLYCVQETQFTVPYFCSEVLTYIDLGFAYEFYDQYSSAIEFPFYLLVDTVIINLRVVPRKSRGQRHRMIL